MTIEEFEEKCMDVIEQIVSIDIKQNRQGAIKVSEKMLEKAKAKGNKKIITRPPVKPLLYKSR